MNPKSPPRRPLRGLKTLGLLVALLASVLSAGLARADAPSTWSVVAKDGFNRSASSSWGTAESGRAWTLAEAKASSVAVAGGTGTMNIAANSSARMSLNSLSVLEVDTKATFVVPKLAGATTHYAVEARKQSSGTAYRGRVIVSSSGALTVAISRHSGTSDTSLGRKSVSGTASAGKKVHVELSATGSSPVSLKMRAWLDGSAVPDWQLTVSDSSSARISSAGATGCWVYVSAASGTASVATDEFTTWKAPAVVGAPPAPAPEPPAEVPPVGTPSGSRGALSPGQSSYAVPSGAIFVSTSGSDSGAGSQASPYRTLAKAVAVAASGKTIVLRAGTYNESVIVTRSNITIQSYPKEAVWLDGSVPLTNWTASGSSWVSSGWTYQAARSGDSAAQMSQDPLAAWTDQVFLDGKPLKQVSSAGAVGAGKFYVDQGAKSIRIGSNPSGHEVRSSNKSQAIWGQVSGLTVRGIGVRRYATAINDRGAIRSTATDMTIENVVAEYNATTGIAISGDRGKVNRVTARYNEQVGVGMHSSYGLRVTNSIISYNNGNEMFYDKPVAGGLKITGSRDVIVDNVEADGNGSSGIWCDESCYDVQYTNNTTNDNYFAGLYLEISENAIVANNQSSGNRFGILLLNTGHVKIFNNELENNEHFSIKLGQDARRQTQTSMAGHDRRRPLPDSTVPWITRNITISNNIIGKGSIFQLYALDGQSNLSADSMQLIITGNFLNTGTNGLKMVGWGGGDNKTVVHYATPAELAKAKNSSWSNYAVAPTSLSAMRSQRDALASLAVAVPSDVANAVGIVNGTRRLGVIG